MWADGDDKLTESLVVVEYLDQKYGKDTPLLPRDPLQHAKVSSYGNVEAIHAYQGVQPGLASARFC